MKTAIQQLIDIIDKGISVLNDSQIKERIILEGVKGEAEKLLETEKEQVINAFHKGQVLIFEIIKSKFPKYKFEITQREVDLIENGNEINEDAEQYYTQTFKSDDQSPTPKI